MTGAPYNKCEPEEVLVYLNKLKKIWRVKLSFSRLNGFDKQM